MEAESTKPLPLTKLYALSVPSSDRKANNMISVATSWLNPSILANKTMNIVSKTISPTSSTTTTTTQDTSNSSSSDNNNKERETLVENVLDVIMDHEQELAARIAEDAEFELEQKKMEESRLSGNK